MYLPPTSRHNLSQKWNEIYLPRIWPCIMTPLEKNSEMKRKKIQLEFYININLAH